MKETFKILSRLDRHRAHVETEVTIDWAGITDEQMQILARGFLVYCAQAIWARDKKAPEEHFILAKEQAHPYVPTTCRFEIPKPKARLSEDFEKLMASLTEGERQELLAAVAAMA